MNWSRTTVLVTGGTGSFGRKFVELVLKEHKPRKVIVFSRDEHKQHELRRAGLDASKVELVIGDVRDVRSLREALQGVNVVVHAAALKQVPVCEAQPMEAIQTNLLGAQNLIDAAREARVARVIALSTDKAVQPVNVYGATKLLAERLFLQANARSGARATRFSCVRYGNVLGSRGSLVPVVQEQRRTGRVTITDPRMTRFWLPLEEAARFVLRCANRMRGGEVFIPKVRSARITELIAAIAPDCAVEPIGRRPGEKIHEVLLSEDEAPYAVEEDGMYVLRPWEALVRGRRSAISRYASDTAEPLTADELRRLVEGAQERRAAPKEPKSSPRTQRAPAAR